MARKERKAVSVIEWVSSEEAKTVYITMCILTQNPKLRIKNLGSALAKEDYQVAVNKDFMNMSYANLQHYYYCAKLFLRLRCALEERISGYEYWEEKDYKALINTGIMLCDVAYTILRIRENQRFLVIMKKAADFLPLDPHSNVKGRINNYLSKLLGKMDLSEFFPPKNAKHNAIRDHVGVRFLHEAGCTFVTKEAVLEKRNKVLGEKGLRLDLYGWSNDSSIIGIEVKTKISDFGNTLTEERFGRYLKYCSKFYILTTSRDVFIAAKRWCSLHTDTGALYYNREEPDKLEIYAPKASNRKVTERMLQKAQEIFLAKTKKLVGETFLESSACTPEATMEQITQNLAKEMLFNNVVLKLDS